MNILYHIKSYGKILFSYKGIHQICNYVSPMKIIIISNYKGGVYFPVYRPLFHVKKIGWIKDEKICSYISSWVHRKSTFHIYVNYKFLPVRTIFVAYYLLPLSCPLHHPFWSEDNLGSCQQNIAAPVNPLVYQKGLS